MFITSGQTLYLEWVKSVTEPSKEEASSKGPSKYVPPGMRAAQAAAASSSGPTPLRRGKKNAPNISSEEDFPTLGMVAPVEAPDR